ncbi:MAG: hypothetical protein JW990_18185 [Thermoleophilia bacterium]|nr:hypothetical protein [Thermoleophilia bacterium]
MVVDPPHGRLAEQWQPACIAAQGAAQRHPLAYLAAVLRSGGRYIYRYDLGDDWEFDVLGVGRGATRSLGANRGL